MAKRRSTRGGAAPTKRQPKARSKKVAAPTVEVVEESKGESFETGIAIVTAVMLLTAILFVDSYLAQYGAGFLMK